MKEKLLKSILPVIALVLLMKATSCKKSADPVSYSGSTMLSESRASLAAAGAGNKILFAGGEIYNVTYDVSNRVDIYDVSSGTWTTAQLSEARNGLAGAAAGNKILFAGGYGHNGGVSSGSKTVDIYDVLSNTWTTAQLSEARGSLAGAAAGNKILFAGGFSDTNGVSKTVDIYDVPSNTWSTAQLSEARQYLAAATAGNKIFFAGGDSDLNLVYNNVYLGVSKTVDIYDALANTWTTAQLSEARTSLAGAAAGNKVFFAGGLGNNGASKTVDIYDVSSNTWTATQLSEGRAGLVAAAAGNYILFGGGYNPLFPPGGVGYISDGGASNAVDIYNIFFNTWTKGRLSEAREYPVAAGAANKILFAGGYISPDSLNATYSASNTVDIFTLSGQ
jgi:Galactose oxidase, central domain/Kelch motif